MLGAGLVVAYAVIASFTVGHPVLSPKQGQLDVGAGLIERTWTTVRMTYAVFPLILLPGALWVGLRSRREWLIPCLYVLALPLYDIHVQQRLLLPALPFLLLLAGSWLHSIGGMPRRSVLAASGVLVLLGTFPTLRTLGSRGVVTPRAAEIGSALASHLEFDDRVAGRFPFVAYYAGAGFVRMPLANYDTLMRSVADMGATHLIVLESEMQNITPHLERLFNDPVFTAAEGRLQAVAWVDEPPGHRAILYRMREPDLSETNAPVLRRGVQGVAWMGDDLVVATPAGLERIPVRAGVSAPDTANAQRLVSGRVLDPAANTDGTRVAFIRPDGARTLVALYDAKLDEFTSFDGTSRDRPVSPTFVDDDILYVRTASPGGLRLLNPETGRVRDVALEGLSSAEATPLAVTARERDLAMTYVRTQPRTPRDRVIATATWPVEVSAWGVVEVRGKWATELSLTDDRLAWLPGERRVLASIGIRILDAEGNTAELLPSLAVVHSSALYRRLSFDLQSVRRPALRDTRLVFLTGEGDLRGAWLEPVDTEIPRTRVYDSVLQAP